MGKLKKGILGGFSGKVGNVVGASWKGIDYIRSLPASVKNPRTQGQVAQRTKFSTTMEFLRPLNQLINEGFRSASTGKLTAMNAAMSYNVKNAVKGELPDFEMDFERVLFSRGSLVGAATASANFLEESVVYDWESTGTSGASSNDNVILVAYNADRKEAVYSIGVATRVMGYGNLAIPGLWEGDTLHTYIAFVSEDGKTSSNSMYTGSVLVD